MIDPLEFDATQTAITDAAAACAATYGFSGMPTRRIAQQAGVNEVTLFRRFINKSGIINAAFQREAAAVIAKAGEYTADLEADLLRILETYIDVARKRSFLTPIILLEMPGNSDLVEAAAHPLQVQLVITGILERYQQEGYLKREPLMATLAALIGPMFFALFAGNIYPTIFDQFDAQDFVRNFRTGVKCPDFN